MASLARRGSCIAFQTVIGIERELASGALVYVPLADKRLPLDRLKVVARRGAGARPAADAFLSIVKRRLLQN